VKVLDIEDTRLYRTGEVAALIGVTRQTVLSWIKKGWIRAVRFGKHYRIRGSDLRRFLDEGTRE